MSNCIHFLNGSFVTEDKLLISPRDLGFIRGYAVNDFIVTFNHKPFKVHAHVQRLFRSAAIYGLQIPWTKRQIVQWIEQTFEKNDTTCEKTMKIVLSGGISSSMYQEQSPTLVMIVNDFIPKPAHYFEQGVKAKTMKYKRPDAEAKHTYHVQTIRQLAPLKENGVTEVIYYDESQVFEAGGSNIFAVIDNTLVTTKSNIVEGLIRNTLLEILRLPIPIEVKNFSLNDLMKATEVFLTNSRNGSIGVVEIDEKPVGDGTVGTITQAVSQQYKDYMKI